MSIRRKVVYGFALVLFLFLFLAATSLSLLTSLTGTVDGFYERQILGLVHLNRAHQEATDIRHRFLSALSAPSPRERQMLLSEVAQHDRALREALDLYVQRSAESTANVDAFERAWAVWRQDWPAQIERLKSADPLVLEQARHYEIGIGNAKYKQAAALLNALMIAEQDRARLAHKRNQVSHRGVVVLLTVLVGLALFAVLFHVRMLGKSLKSVTTRLEDVMGHLTAAAPQLQAVATQQASGAAEQAASVGEVTATVEELSRTAQQIAHSAEQGLRAAEDGQAAVQETAEGMRRIATRVDEVAGRILSLGENSQRIGEINEIISDVSGKTHLLALNAAIESAAAGEFGARFAVVAAQVKELADETKEATGQVKAVIREIQSAINASVMATEETTREVNRGAELSARADQVIGEIVERVQGINLATQQQQLASEQVVAAMHDIQEVARMSAEGSRQTAEGASRLADTSTQLRKVIAHLSHDQSRK